VNVIKQLGVIFAFSYLGAVVAGALPMRPPSSIVGMLLLLGALRSGLLPERLLGETGDFLAANMGFFFLPPAVEILESYPLVQSALPEILLICVVSTVLTFAAAYGAARGVQLLQDKNQSG
jgi:holin-like protein